MPDQDFVTGIENYITEKDTLKFAQLDPTCIEVAKKEENNQKKSKVNFKKFS